MEATNPPPPMSAVKRAEALARAAAARRRRAEIKVLLKTGSITLEEVFDDAEKDPVLAGTRLYPLLTSLPGMGKVKAKRLMEELGIPENRRIRGLGRRQRATLLSTIS